GVRLVELADGKERGVRAAEVRTGTGFAFTVLIDRGLDVSHAEWCGRALNWRSMTEDAHPAYLDPQGLGWVRTFYGGLVVTCGRKAHMLLYRINTGFPALDEGSQLLAPSKRITPRDAAAEDGKERARQLDGPIHAYQEKAYFHDLAAGADGMTGTAIVNRALG